MTPDFIKGLDMLKQMQSLTGCCDTQPPVVVYRDRPGQSQPAAAVPDGWVLVPRVPTPEMLRAAQLRTELGAYACARLAGAYDLLCELFAAMAAAAPQAPQQAETWRPIETAPKDGRKLILTYTNRAGKGRTVMARWLTDEQAAETDTDGVGLTGGWYECIDNWADYTEVGIHEGEPSHWMPLPAPPATPAA